MRKAGEISAAEAARKALANSRQSSASTLPPPTSSAMRQAAIFWRQMAQIYGHKWLSQQGETPTELWSTAVSALSPEQLSRGLAECLRSGEAWPPSLPEFLAMCRPPTRENAAAYRAVPMLAPPTSSPERAHEELTRLRGKLTRTA